MVLKREESSSGLQPKRSLGTLFAAVGVAMWVIVPVVVLALGVILRDAGATKGQSLVASYASLLVLVALAVKLLSVLDHALRGRTTRPSAVEISVVVSSLLVMAAIVLWFFVGDTCDTGLYVCG
ncbi:MAG: hypothetical protein JHD02_02445 [Thermoleophilaceae bacterium]|nr:hypothetical protein [Thermoleophilaceae bacterium]